MYRLSITAILAAALCATGGRAQDAGAEDTQASPAGRSPAENVRAGHVRERAPGTWINAARARHQELIDQRLNAARFGTRQQPEDQGQQPAAGAGGGSSVPGGSSTLGDLLSQIGGSGSLGSLVDLLGSFTGLGRGSNPAGSNPAGAQTATGGGTTAGSTSGGSGGGIPANIPPDVIEMIRNAGIDISGLFSKQREQAASGGPARLPGKDTFDRAQQQDERKFHVRLVDSLLSTFFTALAVGLQSPDVINAFADFLRPILLPGAPADTTGQTGTGADGGSTGGSAPTGGGSGIEDLNPDAPVNQDSGSIVGRVSPTGLAALRAA